MISPGDLFNALGYATGGVVLLGEARRRKLATPGMRLVGLSGIVGGLLGARVTEWVFGASHALSSQPLAFLDPRNGGKSLVGGLIVGWLCVEIAKRRLGIKRSTGDLWALALPAGEAVGRLGCHFNCCCFGTSFQGVWAIHQHDAWRHPTQLYSGICAALIFALLRKLRDSMSREGDLFRLYLFLYGTSRLLVEFFRDRSITWGSLSTVQLICLETAVVAAISLYFSHRRSSNLVTS